MFVSVCLKTQYTQEYKKVLIVLISSERVLSQSYLSVVTFQLLDTNQLNMLNRIFMKLECAQHTSLSYSDKNYLVAS